MINSDGLGKPQTKLGSPGLPWAGLGRRGGTPVDRGREDNRGVLVHRGPRGIDVACRSNVGRATKKAKLSGGVGGGAVGG